MLTPFARLLLGAITDFVMTAGTAIMGYMVAKEGVVMPTAAMWLLAAIAGAVAAAKHVRGMALDLNKAGAVLLALSLVGLTGCSFAAAQMTPEQLAAMAKVKDANVTCFKANTPYGTAVTVYVNVDKGVVPAGSVSVDAECKVTLTAAPPAR